MNLSQIHNVYFIGIGGIGMSALARYFQSIGKKVAGYDKVSTKLTSELEEAGISVHYKDDISAIPADFYRENTLVIITPAIPKIHSEWLYLLEREFMILKRAEVLGLITKDTYCFAVAGTHGKTTTSAILGHLLHQSGVDVTAFIGGIVENYNTNLIGNGKTVTVVEADEFDRSFLHLHPDVSCVTSTDADHLDIYGDVAAIVASFGEFAAKTTDSNKLFVAYGLKLAGTTVGVGDSADYSAVNIRVDNGSYLFDIKTPSEVVSDIRFALPGRHNLMNAMMAFVMARTYGISDDRLREALGTFMGVRRRFSYKIRSDKFVYIDDYAHHPTEINAVHQAVTELYPGQKTLAVFQPHLFSRTRDFIDGFAKSLSQFDEVLLLDIYPAREHPIVGVTSEWLLSKMTNSRRKVVTKEQLADEMSKSDATVKLTIGAGDIGEMTEQLKAALL
jgi:UDP-N-acetylmuramate--alanine ligase